MRTFKQFISESPPTPNNMDDSFNIGGVKFDNRDGMGATGLTNNVIYKGAVAWIKPSTFLALATSADRSADGKKFTKLMKDGKAIAVPWLDIHIENDDTSDPGEVQVVGHEGRARALAVLAINGDAPMPVQLHPQHLRARHLSQGFFDWIEAHGVLPQDSNNRVKLHAKMYYWQGEQVSVSPE